jgi:hypothetical protein
MSPPHELLSHEHFDWFLSAVTGVVAAYWIGIDSYRLWKALRMDRKDLAVRDRIFGSMLGILVGITGVVGVIIHNTR